MIKISKEERGWGGHFACAHDCRFRRNTLISKGDIYIVVSTVGSYSPRNNKEVEPIGINRYYETMAFYSDEEDYMFHDADIDKEVSFKGSWSISEPYKDNEANDMHENIVNEISDILERGMKPKIIK